jgi:hypothetical protein
MKEASGVRRHGDNRLIETELNLFRSAVRGICSAVQTVRFERHFRLALCGPLRFLCVTLRNNFRNTVLAITQRGTKKY